MLVYCWLGRGDGAGAAQPEPSSAQRIPGSHLIPAGAFLGVTRVGLSPMCPK